MCWMGTANWLRPREGDQLSAADRSITNGRADEERATSRRSSHRTTTTTSSIPVATWRHYSSRHLQFDK
ncbi:unnamed protein product [Toxocara canis]|uniref:Uncharacterized protein n=1 Tax=Toxocara canis TaxID=6265 RepID=A0A183UKC7_TOXCA|nr:unnamed protein product [Toxocara canis]